ncbi:hypothetical protein AKJ49_01095 [candidate division MSBL1 archaeon SCGC-AAA382A03]|uniref:DUF1616 domain-containing protein n=1 Tax=candidate division MSBL1 archaeon SCGC-AAA382A03 TaxID=1698278 RepID=A0A133VFS3_9EURY|nr:hypothetical protein AKJ49_01095 [candidate division MSBL1 archaeon SCGC-AAA382A03]
MRPGEPSKNRILKHITRRRLYLIIGILAIVFLVIGYLTYTDNSPLFQKNTLYISESKLQKNEISQKENTLLKIKVNNKSGKNYENVIVQITTKTPRLEISPTNKEIKTKYENKILQRGEHEYLLNTYIPLGLGKGEESRLHSFEITGNLYPGLLSMKVEIEVRIIGNGEKTDSKNFQLKINS